VPFWLTHSLTHTHMHTYAHMHTCTHTHAHTCTHTSTHTRMHTHTTSLMGSGAHIVNMHVRGDTHGCISCTNTLQYTHCNTHAHTHTHGWTRARAHTHTLTSHQLQSGDQRGTQHRALQIDKKKIRVWVETKRDRTSCSEDRLGKKTQKKFGVFSGKGNRTSCSADRQEEKKKFRVCCTQRGT
jgi:hypothetical protein